MDDFHEACRAMDLELIRRVLDLVREIYEQTGRWPTAGELFARLMRGPQ